MTGMLSRRRLRAGARLGAFVVELAFEYRGAHAALSFPMRFRA